MMLTGVSEPWPNKAQEGIGQSRETTEREDRLIIRAALTAQIPH